MLSALEGVTQWAYDLFQEMVSDPNKTNLPTFFDNKTGKVMLPNEYVKKETRGCYADPGGARTVYSAQSPLEAPAAQPAPQAAAEEGE